MSEVKDSYVFGNTMSQSEIESTSDDIPIVKELQDTQTQPEDDTEIQIQKLAKSIKVDEAVKEDTDEKNKESSGSSGGESD